MNRDKNLKCWMNAFPRSSRDRERQTNNLRNLVIFVILKTAGSSGEEVLSREWCIAFLLFVEIASRER